MPTGGEVGLLAQVTYYVMVVKEHRAAMVLHAIICLIAGLSYFVIQDNYRYYLETIARVGNPAERLNITREAYVATGQ